MKATHRLLYYWKTSATQRCSFFTPDQDFSTGGGPAQAPADAMAELATVHLFPRTTCSRRVLMCLAELGCKEGSEFAINLVSPINLELGCKSAAHMRLQPFGKIPAWQEGDWVLYASQHGHTPASAVPDLSSCAS